MKSYKLKYSALLLYAVSLNAQATLTTVDNGLGVYDSVLNVTWTADGNLLGTMENNAIAKGDVGAQNFINNIISANSGAGFTVTAADFGASGLTDWRGAQAFITYLNSIDYGNSNNWALPTGQAGCVTSLCALSPVNNANQLAELFYTELGGVYSLPVPASHFFSNQLPNAYWTSTLAGVAVNYVFSNYTGVESYQNQGALYTDYVWALTPGQASPAPLPGAVWMFGAGLISLLGLRRAKGVAANWWR